MKRILKLVLIFVLCFNLKIVYAEENTINTDEIISKMSSLKNVLSVNKENENLCVTYKKGEENLTGLIEFLKLNNIKYSRIFAVLLQNSFFHVKVDRMSFFFNIVRYLYA